jgi:uncharacterized protein (DUF1330 family)
MPKGIYERKPMLSNAGWFKKGDRPSKDTEFKKGDKVKEKHPNWKNGIRRLSWGYVAILSQEHPFADHQGYVREHRLVMEKHLGRYLMRNEIVHHLNGIKDDNRLENLQLMTSSEHKSFHLKNNNPMNK